LVEIGCEVIRWSGSGLDLVVGAGHADEPSGFWMRTKSVTIYVITNSSVLGIKPLHTSIFVF
jgi:hypothetical protein